MSQPPERAARSQSVRDRTLDHLRRRIVSLNLQPGTPLSENELAAELGVSRTPVRESLILLREEGLVHVFPQVGTFVSRVDVGRVAEAQFIREAIECASLADLRALDPEQEAGLRLLLDEQAAAGRTEDHETFFALDEEFHRTLLTLAGHASAWTSVNGAKVHLDRARRLSLLDARPVSTLVAQHTAVVDALSAADPAAAVAAMRTHLRAVFDDVEKIRRSTPELFADGAEPRPTRRTVTSLG